MEAYDLGELFKLLDHGGLDASFERAQIRSAAIEAKSSCVRPATCLACLRGVPKALFSSIC